MNTPVSFEIAKLLEEKGFDTPTFYYYENEKLVEPYLENGSSTDTEFRVDLSDLQEHFNKWSKRVSAPTIAEVVMWLYEKYDIWIIPSYELNIENHKKEWFWIAIQGGEEVAYQYKDFNSPTEAYEAAILYVLNNLLSV